LNIVDNEIKDLLIEYKKLCIYGLSPDTEKPSHYVPVYINEKGWDVVGVYPKPHQAGNFTIFSSLAFVPAEYRRFVVVFRASDRIPALVDEILSLGGVEVLWLQLGITNSEAEKKAEAEGLKVVSNRCLIIEHRKWF
jgi:uncharacterized protein